MVTEYNTEIDAFTNQYYAYLKQNNIPIEDVINKFPNGDGSPYSKFDDYCTYIEEMEGCLNNEHLKQLFGLNVEQIFKRLENVDKRYRNKMMKVISLYKKENYDKHLKESKNVNLTLTFGTRLNFEMDCYQRGIHETESEFE